MPQIKAELENLCKTGTFPGNPDVLMVEPEHAIAYGAARYAATLNFPKPVPKPGPDPEPDPYRIITMRATHSYGIRYTNSEGSYVDFLIKKGQKLPVVAKTKSYTRFENQKESVFAVYESDYMGTEPVYDKSIWGENVMTITLKRTETRIPKGRESEQTLTLTEDGIITCRCVDQVSGKSVENKVVLKRQIQKTGNIWKQLKQESILEKTNQDILKIKPGSAIAYDTANYATALNFLMKISKLEE